MDVKNKSVLNKNNTFKLHKKNIALIGLGTVGKSVLNILEKNFENIKERTNLELKIVAICDRSIKNKTTHIPKNIKLTEEPLSLIKDPNIDIIIELVGGVELPKEWIQTALEEKKDVITANKALLSKYGKELCALACEQGVEIGFEAAVGGAIPIIRNFKSSLAYDNIISLYCILNGTSNFILSKMSEDENLSYDMALKLAQEKGYAEANPDFDVQGLDAAQKLAILSALAFSTAIQFDKVKIQGIQNLESIDLKFIRNLGFELKPLAIANKKTINNISKLELSVRPTLIPRDHFLAKVDKAMNAIMIDATYAEKLIFIGPGAGGDATASSVISDLIAISKRDVSIPEKLLEIKNNFEIDEELISKFYLRISTIDKPGVLAEITHFLAEYEISIAYIHQHENKEPVNITILTHKIQNKKMQAAIEKMNTLKSIISPIISFQILDT